MYMTKVVITSASERNARRYRQVVEALGAEVQLVTPATGGPMSTEVMMEGVGGLLLPGGPDVDPALYGTAPDPDAGLEVVVDRPIDLLERRHVQAGVERGTVGAEDVVHPLDARHPSPGLVQVSDLEAVAGLAVHTPCIPDVVGDADGHRVACVVDALSVLALGELVAEV